MITIFFQGGLGNQMFQYATGRAVAEKLGTDLCFDTSWYHYPVKRKFLLGAFGLEAKTTKSPLTFASNLLLKKPWFESLGTKPVYREKSYVYDPHIFDVPDSTVLIGVFQTEKYFKLIRETILQDFSLAHLLMTKKADDLLHNIRSSESVAVHIRRGDYLNYPKFNVCTEAYYRRGIDYMKGTLDQPRFFFFSDDLDWCRQHFIGTEFNFCEEASVNNPLLDMKLISYCRHHILSNSSFSWWGAWLNTLSDQKVIIPEVWLNCDDDWSDIPSDGWIPLST